MVTKVVKTKAAKTAGAKVAKKPSAAAQTQFDFALPVVDLIAGVDEAGRGPLAGAVYAAAVILDPKHPIVGLNDSKKLSEQQREALEPLIKTHALAWAVTYSTVQEIDQLNILQATMLAMKRAVQALAVQPQLVLVDGNRLPRWSYAAQAVVGGDAKVQAISAASILAKVARDRQLMQLHALYPQYGFDQHKGYGTALHLERLQTHGPCAEHRASFAPVRTLLQQQIAD